jgi:hypothetical protein
VPNSLAPCCSEASFRGREMLTYTELRFPAR